MTKSKLTKRSQKLEDLLEDLHDCAAELLSGSNNKEELDKASKKVDDILDALANAALGSKKDTYKDDPLTNKEEESPLSKLIKKAKKKVDDVVNSSVMDPQRIPENVNQLKEILEQLGDEVVALAQEDPDKADDLYAGVNAVTQQFGSLVRSVQGVLQNPDDVRSKAKLLAESSKMKDALDDLDKMAGRNPSMNNTIDVIKKKLVELENAKKEVTTKLLLLLRRASRSSSISWRFFLILFLFFVSEFNLELSSIMTSRNLLVQSLNL